MLLSLIRFFLLFHYRYSIRALHTGPRGILLRAGRRAAVRRQGAGGAAERLPRAQVPAGRRQQEGRPHHVAHHRPAHNVRVVFCDLVVLLCVEDCVVLLPLSSCQYTSAVFDITDYISYHSFHCAQVQSHPHYAVRVVYTRARACFPVHRHHQQALPVCLHPAPLH